MGYNFLKKNKKGYTLLEALIAMAIFIIICAIAIPAVANLQKNLEITRYDDVARQVYLITQNKLTNMKSSGTLDVFLDEVERNYGDKKLGLVMGGAPQDYDGDNENWKKLYCLSNDDRVLADFVIGSDLILISTLENGGRFFVELNPETGDVYGVFYSEKEFTYDEIKTLSLRSKEERKNIRVGYYGGVSEFSAISNLPTEFAPEISFVNKEDLYFTIKCNKMRKFLKTQDKINMKVSITDESYNPGDSSENIFSIDLQGGKDFIVSSDEINIEILLDSIRGGDESFKTITENKLKSGDNITVTVSMNYVNDGVFVTGSKTSPVINSLFGSKDADGNISISTVRHLRNLDDSVYAYTGTGAVTIMQTDSIDYNYKNWPNDSVIGSKASVNPYSGTFAPIKTNQLSAGVIYNGNHNQLLNFDISGANDVGLFASLQNATMKDIDLVNFRVTGTSDNIGVLAGQIKGGSITGCRAYLQTKDEYDRPLTDMLQRVAMYRVLGSNYVGGLIGKVENNVVFEESFAAIDVSGKSYVGGLAGKLSGGSAKNSYSSGTVIADGAYAGGFAGDAVNTRFDKCYSTSDVTAPSNAGGFIGKISGGSVNNSMSYGLVRQKGGADAVNSGGFAGLSSTTFNNCMFLRQAKYNYNYTIQTGIYPRSFPDFKITTNSPENAYPYSYDLVENAFPFTMAKTNEEIIIPHYGDWPAELKLQTSLVYYEKYKTADTSGNYYGYYAETSLMAEGDTDSEKVNKWKVNTLRDQECIEDGYALMTIYSLSKFTYELNDDLESRSGITTVTTDKVPGADKSVIITDKVSLKFVNTNDSSTYTISNAKVYQLPFKLQMTDRNTAARFYDKLTMTGYVGKEKMFEDYVFFYCPDFAKNAINPDISKTEATAPKNPTGESAPVFVRSPRHINALARAAYYWNTTKWTTSTDIRYFFKQETDINFGIYTNTYCGETYDLMNNSENNQYRNRPIGRPNSQSFKDPNGDTYIPSNFRNVYDGQNNKIIDYTCITTQEDNYQFTGLFGEVQSSILKNIIMIASEPEKGTGYVISKYNDTSDKKHPGVGALVGLNYVGTEKEYSGNYATISNCAVSGYIVRYQPDSTPKARSAVGGLVGYNFGKIENSTAVNKSVGVNTDSGSYKRYIGGLVGSVNGRGSIINCYAGGELASTNTWKDYIYLGGICGGFDNIHGAFSGLFEGYRRKQVISNSYSYITWKKDTLYGNAYGAVNKMDNIEVSNCYYLKSKEEEGIKFISTEGVKSVDFEGLHKKSFPSIGTAFESGNASVNNSYPWSVRLGNRKYPFAAVVKNSEGAYVHYGDWRTDNFGGKFGAFELYEVRNNDKVEYYASGESIYLDGSKVTGTKKYNPEGTVVPRTYGIFYSDEFAGELDNWIIEYTYKDANDVEKTKTIVLDTTGTNDYILQNAPEAKVMIFTIDGTEEIEEIIFTNKTNKKDYEFEYEDDEDVSFSYDD